MSASTHSPLDPHDGQRNDQVEDQRDESVTPKRRRYWPWAVPAAAIAAVVVVTVIVSVQADDRDPVSVSEADVVAEVDEEPRTILEEAVEFAGAGELADEGASLFLDGEGDDAGSGTVTVDEAISVLVWTEAPDHVIRVMSQTRALDGMQSAEWETDSQGVVTAQWTYHPANGLDIILTMAS